jgi:hypothetical protein
MKVRSKTENDVVGIAKGVQKAVQESGLKYMVVAVFVSGSTAARDYHALPQLRKALAITQARIHRGILITNTSKAEQIASA